MHLHLDGRICTTGVKDKLVRLHATLPPSFLSATAVTSVIHLRHDRNYVPSVTSFLSLDTKRLLIGFDDGSLHCYNTRTGAKICGMTLDSAIVSLLPTTAAYAAIAHSSSMLTPAATAAASTTTSSLAAPACTTHVITYTTDRAFRLIDVQLCRVAKYIGRIGYAHRAFALDSGGGRVAACSGQSVFVWRLYTWTCERTVSREEEEEAERRWLDQHRIMPDDECKDGSSSSSSEWERKESICTSHSHTPPSHYYHSPPSTSLSRTPMCVTPLWSSAFIACAFSSGFVHVWRVGVAWSQRLFCSFKAHEGGIERVWYAGCARLGTSGVDGRVRVWQLTSADKQSVAMRGVACGMEEEMEVADCWHVQLVHDTVQTNPQLNAAVLLLPGD